ncbi:hypothetical protein [Polaribacter sp. R77954]|uniref:hypothetical protein n=1 Tax=Polaribacter sp. R77954 TaxID=3093870 RepID=UPI0037C8F150
MKNLKYILVLVLSVSFFSCGDDNSGNTVFTLSYANIAGTYEILSLEGEQNETATTNSGAVVNVFTSTIVADSFDDVNFTLNSDGTYTATGAYRIVINETPNGGTTTTDSEIEVFEASGTYTINNTTNTITFSPSNDEFVEGLFEVITFSETTFTITQEDSDVNGGITTTSTVRMALVRK